MDLSNTNWKATGLAQSGNNNRSIIVVPLWFMLRFVKPTREEKDQSWREAICKLVIQVDLY